MLSNMRRLLFHRVSTPFITFVPLIVVSIYLAYQAYRSTTRVHPLPLCPRWPIHDNPHIHPSNTNASSTTSMNNTNWSSPNGPQCDRYASLTIGATIDIERWRHHGGITHLVMEQLMKLPEWEGFYIHIRDGEIFVSRIKRGTESRVAATLLLTYIALKDIAHGIPDTTFFITTSDEGPRSRHDLPIMSFNRPTSVHLPMTSLTSLLIPDFTFFAWPESLIGPYPSAINDIHGAAKRVSWVNRTRRLMWRGAHSAMRQPLAQIATVYANITDIQFIGWGGWKNGKRIKVCPLTLTFPICLSGVLRW
jgi:uncharacterized membrane protein